LVPLTAGALFQIFSGADYSGDGIFKRLWDESMELKNGGIIGGTVSAFSQSCSAARYRALIHLPYHIFSCWSPSIRQ
jgi:hypothetical protein